MGSQQTWLWETLVGSLTCRTSKLGVQIVTPQKSSTKFSQIVTFLHLHSLKTILVSPLVKQLLLWELILLVGLKLGILVSKTFGPKTLWNLEMNSMLHLKGHHGDKLGYLAAVTFNGTNRHLQEDRVHL